MKKITIYNNIYWVKRGFSEKDAIKKVKQCKKENSCWNKEFWIVKKGFSEKDAIKKVSEIQTKNSNKQDKKNIKNIYLNQTWIDNGFNEKDAIKKVEELKKKSNIYYTLSNDKILNILEKRKITYYSKTDEERKKINKTRGRTKKQLIDKFGIEYVNNILEKRGQGKRNNIFRRYSKVSKLFFDELNLVLNKNYDLLYAENEIWIRYNKNKGYYVDLIIKGTNKIIEFNGDFFHANPKLYEENSLITISKEKILIAKDIWKNDKNKINQLENLGYDVLIIWENEVLNNKKFIINKCIDFIKK